MTVQSISTWSAIIGVAGGALILLVFGVFLALPHRRGIKPGSRGHRSENDDEEETIAPDGFIDSFANVIEEAGGGTPPLVKIALVGVILWWFLYLILNWSGG